MSSNRPVNKQPAGTENYDNHALENSQQQKLNQRKINSRFENENYLRAHPEITFLMQDFLKNAYLNKPEDVREFAARYFTDPSLKERLNELLETNEKKAEIHKIVQQMKIHDLK